MPEDYLDPLRKIVRALAQPVPRSIRGPRPGAVSLALALGAVYAAGLFGAAIWSFVMASHSNPLYNEDQPPPNGVGVALLCIAWGGLFTVALRGAWLGSRGWRVAVVALAVIFVAAHLTRTKTGPDAWDWLGIALQSAVLVFLLVPSARAWFKADPPPYAVAPSRS